MERIEYPEKYQSKEPLKKRVLKFVLKYILWIPIILLFVGLLVVLLIYQQQRKNDVKLGVDYEHTIAREDYQDSNVNSRLQQFQDKIFQKDQVKRRGRYEHIVSGRDVVSVDFGQTTYPEENTLPKKEEEGQASIEEAVTEKTVSRPIRKKKSRATPEKVMPSSEDIEPAKVDSISEPTRNPFASMNLASNAEQKFTMAFVYGDQELAPGSFIKLRLGQPLELEQNTIPAGTIFTGKISMSANAIHVKVNRIERFNVEYEVFDRDFSYGIILNRSKNQDMENAASTTAYRSAGRSVVDLPYEILQDVTQSIIRNKRERQRTIKLNDGYTVYLAKG